MGFYLIATERDGDEVRLLSERVFDTRNDAVAELSAMLQDGRVTVHTLALVADTHLASPVVFLAAVPEASAGREETVAGEVDMAASVIEAEPQDVTDVAPPIEAVDEAIAEAVIEASMTAEPVMPEELPEAAPAQPSTEAADGQPTAESWPWEEIVAAVEPAEGVEAEAPSETEHTDEEAFDLDSLEEPAVDGGDMLVARVDDETLSNVRPLRVGEFAGETTPEPEDAHEPEAPVAEVVEPVDDASEEEPPPAAVAEVVSELVEDMAPVDPPTIVEAASEEAPDEIAPEGTGHSLVDIAEIAAGDGAGDLGAEGEPGYEPGSDLAEFTCDECVYVNTCPKHHEAVPAECGSFQWRAS